MLFGKPENNQRAGLFKIIFALLIFCGGVSFTACQTKEERAASTLKKCRDFLDKDDFSAAPKCYAEAAKANPENAEPITDTGAEAIFGKCGELRDKNDFENAAVCYDNLTLLKPNGANLYFLLADSYTRYNRALKDGNRGSDELNGFTAKAETAVKKGLEIKPDDAWGTAIYGDILELKGDSLNALLKYEQAVKLEPQSELYWIKLARAQEFKYPLKAIDSYQRALSVNPESKVTLYYLGVLYENAFQPCRAVETFEKLIKLDAEYDDTGERLKRLRERFVVGTACREKNPDNQSGPNAGSVTKAKP